LKENIMRKLNIALSMLALMIVAASQAAPTVATNNVGDHPVLDASKARKNGFMLLPVKKSGSGVSMAYRIEGTPAVGSPLSIRIQMSSPADAQVMLRADEGLRLMSPDQVLQSQAGLSAEHTVTVVPQAEGRFYLNVFSMANGRGSASAIAVQVGKGTVQLKPTGNVQVTPSGERIISVPVQ
jgi:hypothetical protein